MKSIGAAIALTIAGYGAAAAVPLAPAAQKLGTLPIVRVAGGCGPGYHRGPFGGCRPNFGPRVVAPVRLPPPCPRGYVRDPDPATPLCYPRF